MELRQAAVGYASGSKQMTQGKCSILCLEKQIDYRGKKR
jgi:hypothetical protein